jgi:hypothetical protein
MERGGGKNRIGFEEIVKEIKDAKYVIETKKIKVMVPQISDKIITKEEEKTPMPPVVSVTPVPPVIDLAALLEEKKEKIEATIKAEEKAKVDSGIEQLQMELLKAKVALINEWIRANKE